jgi:hypothetical protein
MSALSCSPDICPLEATDEVTIPNVTITNVCVAVILLWHVDTSLGSDRETINYTTAIAK